MLYSERGFVPTLRLFITAVIDCWRAIFCSMGVLLLVAALRHLRARFNASNDSYRRRCRRFRFKTICARDSGGRLRD